MISPEAFLDLLEKQGLLKGRTLEKIRKQVAKSDKDVSAKTVANGLVKANLLDAEVVKALLKEAESTDETDDLGLAPLDEDEQVQEERKKPSKRSAESKSASAPAKPSKPAPAKTDTMWDEELPAASTGEAATPAGTAEAAMEGPSLEEAAGAGATLTAAGHRRKGWRKWIPLPKRRRGRKENVWDSSLLLVGGGTLLGLMILGGALTWSLMRQSGDEMLALANEDYNSGSYSQAIHKYNLYLKRCPNHTGVSLARVRLGLARMRQAVEGTSNWPKALEVAKEVLDKIRKEDEFKNARSELASLLPAIAEGLAKQAQASVDNEAEAARLVEQARESLALVESNVLKSMRPGVRLAEVEASLALTSRRIAKGEELNKAVAAIGEAIAGKKTQDAYAICDALLRQYPDLEESEKLKQAVLAISKAEQEAVRQVKEPRPASDEAKPVPPGATLAVRTVQQEVSGAGKAVVCALSRGAAFGLEATSGKVLWRRPVGFGTNGRSTVFPPTPVAPTPGSDLLLVDAVTWSLSRIEATTGRPRWRFDLGEPFDAHPVLAGNELLVATRSGRLVQVDLETGASPGAIQFPQPLRVAPAIGSQGQRVYQVSEHSNLFVLALAEGKCEEVFHLGHASGAVTVAPVVLGQLLVVAEKSGAQGAILRVFALGTGKLKPVQTLKLDGYVDTTPVVSGTRLLVTTDRGAVYVFRVRGTDEEQELQKMAQMEEGKQENLVRFALLEQNQLWIADKTLANYEVRASQGMLKWQWSVCENSVFLQPLTDFGETLFGVRRRRGLPGAVVAALGKTKPELRWETRLAAPLIERPRVTASSSAITAVTATGAIFQASRSDLEKPTVLQEPLAALPTVEVLQPMTKAVFLPDGLVVLSSGQDSDRLAVFDPKETPKRFRWRNLPGKLSCAPMAFGGGLLAPCEMGQIHVVDPRTGGKLTEPFQPALQAGQPPVWREPALVSDRELVVSDGRLKLYRLAVKDDPKPHLAAMAEVGVERPIVSPVALAKNVAYSVNQDGLVLSFTLPDLAPGKSWPLEGACVWGPRAAGDHVFLVNDHDELWCLDANQKLAWKSALKHGPLAGPPAAESNGHFVLASVDGVVWRVDGKTGEELGKQETGRPLGAGPVILEDQLLLSGHDGSLFLVKLPEGR